MTERADHARYSAGAGFPRTGPARTVTFFPPARLRTRTVIDGDRVLVTVFGDLDLDTEQALRRTLATALERGPGGVDLDLSEVGFCDCSGLNVLLSARQQALGDGKAIVLCAASDAVARVLELSRTLPLFAPGAPED
ncbi:STAS domain-containing protein [Streptomyces sp. cg36]|uniref:STAS domain-containing protein n=1 Tax=Streptomyces sp. cg36 TaxID=3238798 RepID=UPI0034E2E94A